MKQKKSARTPDVFQNEKCECGAAALSMILKYYGCSIPMEELRFECGISRDGCTAADIVIAGNRYGLTGKGYKVTADKLNSVPKPCILFWKSSHFVVLEKITGNNAYLNDPALGHRKISIKDFEEDYSGLVLTFEPNEEFEKRQGESSTFKMVLQRLNIDKKGVVFIVLTGFFLAIPGFIIPLVTQTIIDGVYIYSYDYLMALIISLTAMYTYQIAFNYFRSFVLSRVQLKMSIVEASRMLTKMLALPLLFFDQRYKGELSRRMEYSNEINTFIASKYSETLLNILTAALYLILMIIYSPYLTVLGIVGTAISIVVSVVILRPVRELNLKNKQDLGTVTGVVCAGITAAGTVKASGTENEFAAKVIDSYSDFTESEQKLGRTQQVLSVIPSAITSIFLAIITVIGCYYVIKGNITLGTLTAFNMLIGAFVTPINSVISSSQMFQNIRADIAKVDDVDSAKTDSILSIEGKVLSKETQRKLSGTIEVSNVSFGYNPTKPPVIKNVSFETEPGLCVGIVGSSGCGKSTLGKLLSGLLTPWEGSIKYDGNNVEIIPKDWLRGSVSVIHQESMLFGGTLRENLTMWKDPAHRDGRIFNAIKDADLMDFVTSLPDTVDFNVEEAGKNISGGQAQKICIARALVNNPSVLIMDESTSSLDAISEKKVIDNIAARGCTCIIIAHRLSSIRNCDRILVMDKGEIVESGTHDELIALNGLYSKLLKD